MTAIPIVLHVNGKEYALEVEPHHTLLQVLRDDLGLTGTKPNCEEGECGTCTVLLDDLPVNSCLLLAVRAHGKRVRTIEGVSGNGDLHPVQKALIEHGSIQCGYCTPGVVMSAVALFEANPHPTDDEIAQALAGNICRCTGYVNIRQALRAVAGGGDA